MDHLPRDSPLLVSPKRFESAADEFEFNDEEFLLESEFLSFEDVEADTPLEERLLVDQDLYRERRMDMKTYSKRKSSPHVVIERCSKAEKLVIDERRTANEQKSPLKEITQVTPSKWKDPAVEPSEKQKLSVEPPTQDENSSDKSPTKQDGRKRHFLSRNKTAKESEKNEVTSTPKRRDSCEPENSKKPKVGDLEKELSICPSSKANYLMISELLQTEIISGCLSGRSSPIAGLIPTQVTEEETMEVEVEVTPKKPSPKKSKSPAIKEKKNFRKSPMMVVEQIETSRPELRRSKRSSLKPSPAQQKDSDVPSTPQSGQTELADEFLMPSSSKKNLQPVLEGETPARMRSTRYSQASEVSSVNSSLLDSTLLDSTVDLGTSIDDDDDDDVSWDGYFVEIPNTPVCNDELTSTGIAEETKQDAEKQDEESSESKFKVAQAVLAKIGSWPYWPAFIIPMVGQHKLIDGKKIEKYHVVFCGERQRAWVFHKKIVPFSSLEEFTNLINMNKKTNPFFVPPKFEEKWQEALVELMELKNQGPSIILDTLGIKPKITPKEKEILKEHLKALKIAERELKQVEREQTKEAHKIERARLIEVRRLQRQKVKEELQKLREEARGVISRKACFQCRDHENKESVMHCTKCDNFYHTSCQGDNIPKDRMEPFVCNFCKTDTMPCHVCNKHSEGLIQCKAKKCQKVYHLECLGLHWQQATVSNGQLISCPAHSCHSCVHRDMLQFKKVIEPREKLVRCTMCPGTYHKDDECIPAAATKINSHQIVCPRHLDHQNKPRTYKCQVCVESFTQEEAKSSSVWSCKMCPCLYHFKCLDKDDEQTMIMEDFVCFYCRDGYFPKGGDIVWAKLGSSRWWPAKVVARGQEPERLLTVKRPIGQFVVQFYGTNDYSWIPHKSTFMFQSRDDVAICSNSSGKDQKFIKGIEEAMKDFDERDLYWDQKIYLHFNSGLDKKPPSYRRIKKNIYVKPCKPFKEDDMMYEPCHCKPDGSDPCGENCDNRGLHMECLKECPTGDLCQNKRIQLHQDAPTELKLMGAKGWGLTAQEDLKKGTFVVEYVGEVVNKEEFQRRKRGYIENKEKHFYFLELGGNHYIDAKFKGNLSRFINHSCEPNCQSSHWNVLGERRVGLFTLRDVRAGEELTFNYGWKLDGTNTQQCLCNTESCKKSLATDKAKKTMETQPAEQKKKSRSLAKKASNTSDNELTDSCDACSDSKEPKQSKHSSNMCQKCYENEEF
ncbi:histone-lysine N-methyltransferase, H3 lysine-36 specific isoform X2 [Neocloeon triangulifer]|uniref:histone-lysine N-methyltransferase, H3 lysine-36 specific isoform X2 n=1 Tax=Neocloeon triangulifer TaxID=2078957 RepID=UPI00286F45CB|nr:histone-lysine N-methyltransferase, H3 lysine-36 specific isoform X2 [Neocloeon triangulifer]